MHEWRRIATAVDSAQLGFEDRRRSLAQLWSVWGAPTSLHQREPRLQPSQTKSSSISARLFPGMPDLTDMLRLLRWARIPHPDKDLVNPLLPLIQWCLFLPHQRDGVSEGAFIFFWQLRHIGQGAEKNCWETVQCSNTVLMWPRTDKACHILLTYSPLM